MRFRLTYEGPLLSSRPLDKDGMDKRIEHKHDIRRKFHPQLRELWGTNKFLKEKTSTPGLLFDCLLPPVARQLWAHDTTTRRSLADILGPVFGHSGYQFVPLAWHENSVFVSLRILCLRRDGENAFLPGRDIDNRVKTLIDALTMPSYLQGSPLKNGKPLPPQDQEIPFFVLMDNDRQVTHLEIESDTALAPNPDDPMDETYVRVVITVEVRPYHGTLFNAAFA